MKLKHLLSVIAAMFFFCGQAAAQDKIFKRDGNVIEAEVKEVGIRTVTYKRADNTTGPDYVIGKNEIEYIRYRNGSEEYFDDRIERRRTAMHQPAPAKGKDYEYGKNIISIIPLQIAGRSIGAGISYERALDKNGIISFHLPIFGTFGTPTAGFYDGGPSGAVIYNDDNSNNHLVIAPGVKIYPTGQFGNVRYSIGPSLVFAKGDVEGEFDIYAPDGSYAGRMFDTRERFLLGVMVNNGLNMNPSDKIFLGLELGLGLTYINKSEGLDLGNEVLTQFAFKIGYRF